MSRFLLTDFLLDSLSRPLLAGCLGLALLAGPTAVRAHRASGPNPAESHRLPTSPAAAADVAVSGRVTGADGAAIPGATVLEQGTTNGVGTDAQGRFTLRVKPGATLVISAVGFTS